MKLHIFSQKYVSVESRKGEKGVMNSRPLWLMALWPYGDGGRGRGGGKERNVSTPSNSERT